MKKILFILAILCLLPTTARAYMDYYRHYVFFHHGLKPMFTIEKQCAEGCWYHIEGPRAEKIIIDNTDERVVVLTEKNNDEIDLSFKSIPWNDYTFWKINGSIESRRFTLVGLTMEGDFLENKLFFHSIPFVVILVAVFFLCRHWRKNK